MEYLFPFLLISLISFVWLSLQNLVFNDGWPKTMRSQNLWILNGWYSWASMGQLQHTPGTKQIDAWDGDLYRGLVNVVPNGKFFLFFCFFITLMMISLMFLFTFYFLLLDLTLWDSDGQESQLPTSRAPQKNHINKSFVVVAVFWDSMKDCYWNIIGQKSLLWTRRPSQEQARNFCSFSLFLPHLPALDSVQVS